MAQMDPLAYENAPAPPSGRTRLWAAAVILFAGLILIFLGGCFMIGVLELTIYRSSFLVSNTFISPGHFQFQVILLYTLAGACFLGGLLLIIFGLRGLYTIMMSPGGG